MNAEISDEAVAIVARMIREERSGGSAVELHPLLESGVQQAALHLARAALEAAAPAMLVAELAAMVVRLDERALNETSEGHRHGLEVAANIVNRRRREIEGFTVVGR